MLIDIVGHFEESLLFVLQWTNNGLITGARIYPVQWSSCRRIIKESIDFRPSIDDDDDNDNDKNNDDDGGH